MLCALSVLADKGSRATRRSCRVQRELLRQWGPLHGQSYALDLKDGDEVAFTIGGQAHVYRAKIDWDTGHRPDRFAI